MLSEKFDFHMSGKILQKKSFSAEKINNKFSLSVFCVKKNRATRHTFIHEKENKPFVRKAD